MDETRHRQSAPENAAAAGAADHLLEVRQETPLNDRLAGQILIMALLVAAGVCGTAALLTGSGALWAHDQGTTDQYQEPEN